MWYRQNSQPDSNIRDTGLGEAQGRVSGCPECKVIEREVYLFALLLSCPVHSAPALHIGDHHGLSPSNPQNHILLHEDFPLGYKHPLALEPPSQYRPCGALRVPGVASRRGMAALWGLAALSVICGPAAAVSPGSLWRMQCSISASSQAHWIGTCGTFSHALMFQP